MHQAMYTTALPPPGMGRENVGEMRNIDSFCATGVRGCAVALTRPRDVLSRGNTEKYSILSC